MCFSSCGCTRNSTLTGRRRPAIVAPKKNPKFFFRRLGFRFPSSLTTFGQIVLSFSLVGECFLAHRVIYHGFKWMFVGGVPVPYVLENIQTGRSSNMYMPA